MLILNVGGDCSCDKSHVCIPLQKHARMAPHHRPYTCITQRNYSYVRPRVPIKCLEPLLHILRLLFVSFEPNLQLPISPSGNTATFRCDLLIDPDRSFALLQASVILNQ
jgi:hypothetical protein